MDEPSDKNIKILSFKIEFLLLKCSHSGRIKLQKHRFKNYPQLTQYSLP